MNLSHHTLWIAAAAVAVTAAPARARVVFPSEPPPLRTAAKATPLIVYGEMMPPSKDGGPRPFRVREILKGKVALGPDRLLTVEAARSGVTGSGQGIVFCELSGNKVMAWRYEAITSPAAVRYLKELLGLPEGRSAQAVEHCLRHIGDADPAIAADAVRELRAADPVQLADAARKADPAAVLRALELYGKVRLWGNGRSRGEPRREFYARLLGHCGTAEHIVPLRKLVQEVAGKGEGVFGPLQGLTLIRPAEALAAARQVLAENTYTQETRYSALRWLEFCYGHRPEILPRTDLAQALELALEHPDLAMWSVETARQWGRWEATPRVLRVWDKLGDEPLRRRAVLAFALSSSHPDAAAFVRRIRAESPEEVEAAEHRSPR